MFHYRGDRAAKQATYALRISAKTRIVRTGKFRARGEKLREDVHSTAALMPSEEDWFFGAELRLEGQVRGKIATRVGWKQLDLDQMIWRQKKL